MVESDELVRQDDSSDLDRYEARANFYRTVACDAISDCVPLSECTIMQYQAAKSCYSGDRSLNCGSSDVEPYVCCPRSKFDNVHACGKSLVSGQFYKGLGSFPYVARIGFKSEYLDLTFACIKVVASIVLRRYSGSVKIDLIRNTDSY